MTERRQPMSEEDIERIADAVASRTHAAFQLEDEKHYNDHKKLDKMLEAYDNATNVFTKTFLALFIVGAIVIAGLAATRGWK